MSEDRFFKLLLGALVAAGVVLLVSVAVALWRLL